MLLVPSPFAFPKKITKHPRGGYMKCGWTGAAAWFSERHPRLITETCCHTNYYDEFWRKRTHFWLFFANFWITHHVYGNLLKERPLFREFGPKNPPIWGGIYPYPQHVMYPPHPQAKHSGQLCKRFSWHSKRMVKVGFEQDINL